MTFIIPSQTEHILVLGAGASVDYGLPIWLDLVLLVEKKINDDVDNNYKHKEEILIWLSKVGEKKDYLTIDECIYKESVSPQYHSNGHEIENEIFFIFKEIFDELYRQNNLGWIKTLNEKILLDPSGKLEKLISFVSYNYDDVLDKNILNYQHLPGKHLRFTHRARLAKLDTSNISTLYAHGNVYSEDEIDESSHVFRYLDTMKTGDEEYLDAVTCFESNKHDIRRSDYDSRSIKLHILGLGGGLRMNLNNITFAMPISEINVTIREPGRKKEVTEYLAEKYETAIINIYDSCEDLISSCFGADEF